MFVMLRIFGEDARSGMADRVKEGENEVRYRAGSAYNGVVFDLGKEGEFEWFSQFDFAVRINNGTKHT